MEVTVTESDAQQTIEKMEGWSFTCSDGYSVPSEHALITGELPDGWNSEHLWIDLVQGAEVELPGGMDFRCFIDRTSGAFQLRIACTMDGDSHEFSTMLGSFFDLSLLTGFPCVLIPRAIKPASGKLPASLLLEFAKILPC